MAPNLECLLPATGGIGKATASPSRGVARGPGVQRASIWFGAAPFRRCAELPSSPTEVEWTQKHIKALQTAHLALHTIDRTIHAHVHSRYQAVMANQSGLGKRSGGEAARILQKQGTDIQSQ